MGEMELFAQIICTNIKVICPDNEVYTYVLRELQMHLLKEPPDNLNIIVTIRNSKYAVNKKVIFIDRNVYIDGKKIGVCIDAHFRNTWIVVSEINNTTVHIEVFIHKKNSKIKRLYTPNFQYPWQNSLIDFFHGIFLWFLEFCLIKSGIVMVHASAFIYHGRGILLAADAAAGKSTVTDNIVLRRNGKYIAEDYCFVDSFGKIYGLFNQRRVLSCKNDCQGIEEVLNYFLFSQGKHFGMESIRIRSTNEIFEAEKIVKICPEYEGFFLDRNNAADSNFDCTAKCIQIMEREISNWDGCTQLQKAMNIVYSDLNIVRDFDIRRKEIMNRNLSVHGMKAIHIPYMDTEELFVDTVIDKLESEHNEKRN